MSAYAAPFTASSRVAMINRWHPTASDRRAFSHYCTGCCAVVAIGAAVVLTTSGSTSAVGPTTPACADMAEPYRCGLPLNAPAGPHWWPGRDPEPDPAVHEVIQHGQAPAAMRYVRQADGWATVGYLTSYPTHTPPRPWDNVGRCWANATHPVTRSTVGNE